MYITGEIDTRIMQYVLQTKKIIMLHRKTLAFRYIYYKILFVVLYKPEGRNLFIGFFIHGTYYTGSIYTRKQPTFMNFVLHNFSHLQ